MRKLFFITIVFLCLGFSEAYAQDCNIYVWRNDGSLADGPIATSEVSRTILSTEEAALSMTSYDLDGCSEQCCYEGFYFWNVNTEVTSHNEACLDGTWLSYLHSCDLFGCEYSYYYNGTWDVLCYDADIDGIPDNGDNSTTAGDNTCTGGNTENCDDNCRLIANPNQEDIDSDGVGDVCDNCPYDAENDIDSDGLCGDIDNCPNTANPNQEDVDNDDIGDVCDADTIYGTISGDVQEGITVNIYILDCGALQPYANVTTDAQGYYAIGALANGRYLLDANASGYSFFPVGAWVDIPQTVIQSYDFIVTEPQDPLILGTWFNVDGLYLTFRSDDISFISGFITPPGLQILERYTISGDQITFVEEGCAEKDGVYTYAINGTTLNLDIISDPCYPRVLLLPGDWEKQ